MPFNLYSAASNGKSTANSHSVIVNFYNSTNSLLPIRNPQTPLTIYISRTKEVMNQAIPNVISNHTLTYNATLVFHEFVRPAVNESLSIVIKPLNDSKAVFVAYLKFGRKPNEKTGDWDYTQKIPTIFLGRKECNK